MNRIVLLLSFTLALSSNLAESSESAPSNTKAAQGGSDEERFLFIICTSASMRGLEHDGRQALFNLLFSGLDGYMRKGDTFGVWTFNDELTAGKYPMQVWETNNLLRLASSATLFVRDQEYKGRKPCLDRVVKAVQSVVRTVQDLNVILISDDDVQLEGTPFDDLVNHCYQKLAGESRASDQPIVTAMVARKGQLLNATVTLASQPIFLPPRPEPKPALISETAPTNNPPSVASRTRPGPPPASTNSGRIIVISSRSKDSVITSNLPPDSQIAAIPSPTTAPLADPKGILTNAAQPGAGDSVDAMPVASSVETSSTGPGSDPNPKLDPASNRSGPGESLEPTTPGIGLAPEPMVAETEPDWDSSGMASALSRLNGAPQPVAAREPAPPDAAASGRTLPGGTTPLPAVGTPGVPSKTDAILWLAGGVGFLFLGASVVLLFWKLHRKTYQPSAITQSMQRR